MVATAKPLTVYRLPDGLIVTTGDVDHLMLEQPDGSLAAWVYPVHGVETVEGRRSSPSATCSSSATTRTGSRRRRVDGR